MTTEPCNCPLCAPRQPDGALTYFPARGGLDHREDVPDQATLDAIGRSFAQTPEAKLLRLPTAQEPLPFRVVTRGRWRGTYPAWQFYSATGIGHVRVYGWGVQWRDLRVRPPLYRTRAQWTKIAIGPYMVRLLRP